MRKAGAGKWKEDEAMLYLVRHGQTEFNVQERIQGLCDSSLTEKGIEDTAKLAKHLAAVDFKEVYASNLGRTIQTARIIQGSRQLPVLSLGELNEMGFGVWEGKSLTELRESSLEQLEAFWHDPVGYIAPEGGQTFAEMFEQVRQGSRLLFARAKNQDILAVSHGMWVKSFCCIWQGKGIADVWEPPFVHNTALTVVDCSGDKPHFVLEADLSHLQK